MMWMSRRRMRSLHEWVDKITLRFLQLETRVTRMALDFARLAAVVQLQTSVVVSAREVLGHLSAEVKDLSAKLADAVANGGDLSAVQAQVDTFAANLEASVSDLSAAVEANTQAAPAPVDAPPTQPSETPSIPLRLNPVSVNEAPAAE
jgi:hypothetical protein